MTSIPRAERLIVALDVPTPQEARVLVEKLGDAARFYKIGLELFTAEGYFELLGWLTARGNKVFADLKLYDIPETVRRAVANLRPDLFRAILAEVPFVDVVNTMLDATLPPAEATVRRGGRCPRRADRHPDQDDVRRAESPHQPPSSTPQSILTMSPSLSTASSPPAARPIYCSPIRPEVRILAKVSFGNL